jgi:hypothetical protein
MLKQAIQHVLLLAVLVVGIGVAPATGQTLDAIRITEVHETEQWVELQNTGDAPVDISTAQFCANFRYPEVQQLAIFATDDMGDGDLTLASNEFIALEWDQIDASSGDIALYVEGPFGDPDNIIDYVRWGDSGADREDVAVDAGIWTQGASAEAAPSEATIAFLGDDPAMNDTASDWKEGQPTPAAQNTLLPVELASFEAVESQSDVVLTWRTASETNNAGFEVQHRIDGPFEAIGFVEGTGTTSEPQEYRFRHADATPGTHAFRLKQIDVGGATSMSPVVTVSVQPSGAAAVSALQPNPSGQTTQLAVTVASSQRVRVAVYDVLGRRVRSVFDGTLSSGVRRTVRMDGSGLSSGVYLVRVVGDRFAQTRRWVVSE